jgi:hypothetical protein
MLISVSSLELPLPPYYIIGALADVWRAAGHTIHIGADYHPQADLCILHHDRSRLDPAALPSAPEGVRLVNGDCLDITKTRVSSNRLYPESQWAGPVIVKTVLNCYGLPERAAECESWMRRKLRPLAGRFWRVTRVLPDARYPVLPTLSAVPGWVWRAPDLLVEKFLPERADGLYSIRSWLSFGAAGYGVQVFSPEPVVKTHSVVKHAFFFDPPAELAAWRARFRIDFAKFDYVVNGGRVLLLDVNKTPTFSGPRRTPRLERLAEGLDSLR